MDSDNDTEDEVEFDPIDTWANRLESYLDHLPVFEE